MKNLNKLFFPNPLNLKHFKGDFFGGLTTGIVALPLALAFGVASGLPEGAKAGIYSAIFLGFIAAIFGGTVQQVSGPTGPMTVVAAGFVATSSNPQYIFAAVFLGGLLQICFGLLGAGHYIRYVPKPVVTGFMTGIGVIIFIIQILPLLGLPSVSGTIQAIAAIPDALFDMHKESFLLGISTISIIYLFPRITKAVPSTLVALVLTTIAAEVFKLEVARIGKLPEGLPEFSLLIPDPKELPHVLLAAITLAILGSLDSLIGSVVVDSVTKTKHDSDKELVGQGMGNAVAGLFGALPGAGATMRTLLNIRTGAKSALSGVIHSVLLLCVLLGLSKYASLIPLSVLAGILITVGIGIIDYQALRIFKKLPKADKIVFVLVLGLTVFVDLISAVQMGFLVGCLLFMKNLSDAELTRAGSLGSMVVDQGDAVKLADRVKVIQAEGPLFFGTSESFLNEIEVTEEDTRAIILRMSRVPVIDQTGAETLQEFVSRMQEDKNIEVAIVGLPEEPLRILKDLQIVPNTIAEDSIYLTLADAISGLSKKIATNESEVLQPQSYVYKVIG